MGKSSTLTRVFIEENLYYKKSTDNAQEQLSAGVAQWLTHLTCNEKIPSSTLGSGFCLYFAFWQSSAYIM
jgi:hypothetical protein